MKNQNLIAAFVACIVLLLTVPTGAVEVEVQEYTFFDRLADLFTEQQPFYISGGTFSNSDDVNKGEKLDAEIYVKFKRSTIGTDSKGRAWKLILYFVDEANTKNRVSIGTFYYKSQRKQGEYIKVNVRGMDTSKLPDSWCSKGVKVAGMHYVWQEIKGVGSGWTLDSRIVTDGGIGESINYDFTNEKTNANFRLVCKNNNPCPGRSLGYVCRYGDRNMKREQTYVGADGKCKIGYDRVPCPSGTSCVDDGNCEYKKICDSGEYRCNLNGKVSETCKNNKWSVDEVCTDTGKCEDGRCVSGQSAPQETSQDGEDAGNEESGMSSADCGECEEDVLCDDGVTVFLGCDSNGCFVDGDLCPSSGDDGLGGGYGDGGSRDGGSGSGGGSGDELQWYEGLFDPGTMNGKVGIGVTAGLVIGVFAFIIFMPGKKKKGGRRRFK